MSDIVKIAVVDDEPSILESLKLILKIKDYEISTFEKAVDFLEVLKKDTFNIVIHGMWLQKDPLPYGRSGLNGGGVGDGGLELLKKIKRISPNTEVIVITGNSSKVAHVRAMELGALDYLLKPFMMRDIYNVIDKALKKQAEVATSFNK